MTALTQRCATELASPPSDAWTRRAPRRARPRSSTTHGGGLFGGPRRRCAPWTASRSTSAAARRWRWWARSGCGKSTVGPHDPPAPGADRGPERRSTARTSSPSTARSLRRLRRRMQIIFQDPVQRLNPRMTIGAAVARRHRDPSARRRRGDEPPRRARCSRRWASTRATRARYPHEFSRRPAPAHRHRPRAGGRAELHRLRRAGLGARRVACRPRSSTCWRTCSASSGCRYLFIAHDLAVVRQIAQRVAVMYLGRIVETGRHGELLPTRGIPTPWPCSPPSPSRTRLRRREPHRPGGRPAQPSNPPPGCPFHTRCFHPSRDERCRTELPLLRPVGSTAAACHYAELTPAAETMAAAV